MPAAPLAEAVIDTRDRAGQATPPDAGCTDRPGGVAARIRGDLLRRVASLLRRSPWTGGPYHDPLFAQPDLVEDDYYRFRNQPGGW